MNATEAISQRRMRLCMMMDRPLQLTETFMQAQFENLPFDVTFVQGFLAHINGRPVVSFSLPSRAIDKAIRITTGKPYQAEATRSYCKAFAQTRADLVLAQYGPNGVHVLDACIQSNLPLVVHFHGFDASNREVIEENRTGYGRLFEYAESIVVVSRDMRERLIALGAPEEKLLLNPYGVDLESFAGASPETSSPTFLTVGRFTEKKAPFITILAFAELLKSSPEVKLRMIGDGALLEACKQLVEALQLSNAVTFLGSQPSDVIQQEMRSARCFVQHSVIAPSGDAEGTPVAVIEACASGLPVVATRHAGIPDVILEGETGLLVDEYDLQGMATALSQMAADPIMAGKFGCKARERVQQRFSMEQSILGLSQILQSSLDAFSARSSESA